MRKITDLENPRYIDPMRDFGFKKIFKESGNKQLLIRPLNAFFGLDISDLEIRESEHLGESEEDRSVRFDLDCASSDGKKFIVEVQIGSQPHFLERALFYTTFPIQAAARKGKTRRGKSENWDYSFPPVFFLGLLAFSFRELEGHKNADPEQFIHSFSLRDNRTGEQMTDRLNFVFLEIERFDKPLEECTGFEEQFLYVMKNLPTFAESPKQWEGDPYFRSILEEAEFARMSREDQERYKKRLKMGDYKMMLDYAVKRGHAEGRVEGRVEGQAEEKQAIARRMLAKEIPAETVAELTELTESDVQELAAESETKPERAS